MAFRHKNGRFAKGGGVAPKHEGHREMYTGKGSHVEHEAEEKNRGGKVKADMKATGGPAKPRLDKKARGGSVKAGKIHEGADMTASPFSAAHIGHGSNHAEHPHPHHLKKHGVHGAKG